MSHVFLIGGGREPEAVLAAHRPFVAALGGGPVACVVLDEGDDTDVARWRGGLEAAGAGEVRPVVVSASRPPAPADVDGVAGVYVAGGWTPGYREVLVGGDWLDPALPYAGFSAGAAVAADRAIVGGWRAGDPPVAICDDGAGEDLDLLELRPGLGLVPFAVEVHAAQWGTLGRLVHAVLATGGEGWAVDEATALEVRDGVPTHVHGLGAATHVRADGDAARVRPVPAGSV